MWTPGSLCGVFDHTPREDSDDLLVPSPSLFTPPANTNNNGFELSASPPPHLPAAAPSDISSFVNEEVLGCLASAPAFPPAPHREVSFGLEHDDDGEDEDAHLQHPAAGAFEGIDLDAPGLNAAPWMNLAISDDDFSQILNDLSGSGPSFPLPPSATDASTSAPFLQAGGAHFDVTMVSLESLLDEGEQSGQQQHEQHEQQQQHEQAEQPSQQPAAAASPSPSCSSSSAPAPAPASSKRRGRPTKAPSPCSSPAPASAPALPKNVEDKEALEKYLRYRRSNNEAASKSRQKRKEREKLNTEMVNILQTQNQMLRQNLSELQSEFRSLQGMLEQFLKQQQQPQQQPQQPGSN